jgi:serine/threonine protein kinase/tetratricopeptide (TPR) repeat protein
MTESGIPIQPGTHARLSAALADRYTIDRELGGGGMSRVFVATETALNRTIVIKVIAPELLDGMSVERFAREVRLAARLQHANIVPVLAAGDADGTPYYTMPFVRGESLRARMATGVPMPLAEAVQLLRDVARALAYAHGEGVMHRDIKPENILLSGGAAVVTDFGIAKAVDVARTQDGDYPGAVNITLTQAGSALGTPAYMAPEQATGDPNVDHHADIYAWGLVAWELLAGHHPFSGKTSLHALVAAQITETPLPLASVRPDVPAPLSQLIQHCLEKDAAQRPASAAELLATLDQATPTGDRPVQANPIRSVRPPVMVGTLAAIALIAVAAWTIKGRFSTRGLIAVVGQSLAVIPFTSTSSDTGNAYLGEGIADEVTSTLSQVPGLRLAGRTSSARFAGKATSVQEIGKTLQVGAVLDGTVRRVGDQIRVSAELSNATTGQVLWNDTYQRAATDIVQVQDDIARAIAGALQVTLNSAASSAAHGTADPVAYDLYLKGTYLYRRRGPDITGAIAAFEQATARDSMFAHAWASLSNALTVSPYYISTRTGDVLPRARAAADRAIALDSTLADGHLALGYVDAEVFDWPGAERELKRAIALDPTAAEPRYRLGYTLMNEVRPADAIPTLQAAVARDPLSFVAVAYLGWAEVEAGRVAEGLGEEQRSVALEPQSVTGWCLLAIGFVRADMPDSARAYAHRITASTSAPARIGVAAYVLARSGATDEARTILRQLQALPADAWTRWTGLTMAYAGLRDTAAMADAMIHAAAGDGDALPTYVTRVDLLPIAPRIDAVLQRYHLDRARFSRTGKTAR